MGKVVLFAVLTMDGCLADSSREAQEWLSKTDVPDRFGIAEMKETARPLSEYTSLTMLSLDKSGSTFLIEANTATTGIINGMCRMKSSFARYPSLQGTVAVFSKAICPEANGHGMK